MLQYHLKDSYTWSHLREIPNTQLVVSLKHHYDKGANMKVFDISKKGKSRNIYTYEEVPGSNIGHNFLEMGFSLRTDHDN